MAYNITKRAAEVIPDNAAAYHNIGKIYHERQKDKEADEYFRKAIKVKPNFPASLEGLGMSALHRADWEECIAYSNRALAEDPDSTDARVNRGMAYLALRRWREGWRDYDANLGREKNRKEMDYPGVPRWDGTKGLDVVVYGEQGIGDEISFASCLPEIIQDSKSVTIECDKRVQGLFKRSFPKCEVYGTRYKEDREWIRAAKFDAKVAMGALPGFYRLKDSDFHGKPYLTPNPLMSMGWKAILRALGPKPKIGITWTGGIPKTGQYRRSVTLDTYAPLFRGFDAEWISLQYKDADIASAESKYGVKIHDFDWGSRYYDYDQTCALISELDLVISVCTTVVHASGGLGKECWNLVPEVPMWRYLAASPNYNPQEGDWFPWGSSVRMFRQKGKEWPIGILLGKLKDKWPEFSKNQIATKSDQPEVKP